MTDNLILGTLVPGLGAIISLLMYGSPIAAVLQAAKHKSLGDLNPVPLAVTVANTIIWACYGLIKHDPFVTAPNATGIVVALYCCLTTYTYASEEVKEKIKLILCFEGLALPLLGVLTSFQASTLDQQLNIWGIAGNVVTLIYYAAPLSTMAQVVKTKNSASILLPMTIMNTLNAALWTTYGMAMNDIYIYAPNGIGLALSCCLLLLACLYPSKSKALGSGGAAQMHEASYSRLTHGQEDGLPISHKG